jgi:multidrug efflux pump subunit AcrA (membrane-fusion protein)
MKRFLIAVTIIGAVAVGVFLRGEAIVQAVADRLVPVKKKSVPTQTLLRRPFRMVIPAKGELKGFQTVPLLGPSVRRRSLTIAWLIEEGSLVKKGDLLVQFDESEAQLALEASDTEFSSFQYRIEQTEENARGEMEVLVLDQEAAEADLTFANQQIRKDEEIFPRWEIQESLMNAALAEFRKETTHEKGGLRVEVTDSDLKILDIDKRKAEVEIEEAQDTLNKMVLTAPVDGVVIYKRYGITSLEVGGTVYAGMTIMEIASTNQFRAIVQVLEKDSSGVEPGKKVKLTLDAFPEMEFSGKVEKVASIAKQTNREDPRKYLECDVLLEVPIEMMTRLKPGMRVISEIEVHQTDGGLILPKSAIIKKENSFVVYVRDDEDYQEYPVHILASDHGFYEIDGIEEGAEVCLQHPFEDSQLMLPDFSAPRTPTQSQRYFIYW